jgi:nucleotide-binding universal stress UspA family protein
MIKKVLVGTDTSASADLAVSHAAELARSYGAELTVLYVRAFDDGRDVVDPRIAADPDGYLRGLSTRLGGVPVKTRREHGDPAAAICRVAEDEAADVIVVGNRGTHGKRRGFVRSVPANVARQSPCSVLIVDTRTAQ